MLGGVRDRFGLAPGAEVTTEANPDSVTPRRSSSSPPAGFTRVSFGMQSAVPHVLAALDRTHDPARVPQAVAWARAAGLAVSLDLIYGTPGESAADWRASLEAALACEPDHVSAYALVVEEGTRLAVRVRRGELPAPDDDVLADDYEVADDVLSAAGLSWYEVSNWARTPADACRHNLGYWRGDDWWGVGPGAHSHVGGVRWWNVRHPRAYAARLADGGSPAQAREVLTAVERYEERVLLGVRLAEGLPLDGPVAGRPGAGRGPRRGRAGRAVGRARGSPAGADTSWATARRRRRAPPARLTASRSASRPSRATRRSDAPGTGRRGPGVATMGGRERHPGRGRRPRRRGCHVLPGAAARVAAPGALVGRSGVRVLGSLHGPGGRVLQRPLRHPLHPVRLAAADLRRLRGDPHRGVARGARLRLRRVRQRRRRPGCSRSSSPCSAG